MVDKLLAPWSPTTVEALNDYQSSGVMHPYTCPQCRANLVATSTGWVCPNDTYTQNWAHPFTADSRWIEDMRAGLTHLTRRRDA